MERILEKMQKKFNYRINENFITDAFQPDPNIEYIPISKNDAFDLVTGPLGQKIFTAVFDKVGGEERILTGRRGVKKGITGVGMRYNPYPKGLVPVYEMINGVIDPKKSRKIINMPGIKFLKIGGKYYRADPKSVLTRHEEAY